jgi:hypothetical protein
MELDLSLSTFISVSSINAGTNPPRCIMKIYHASHASLFVYVTSSVSSSDESHCPIDSYFRMQLNLWSLGLDRMWHLSTFFLSTRLRQYLLQFSMRLVQKTCDTVKFDGINFQACSQDHALSDDIYPQRLEIPATFLLSCMVLIKHMPTRLAAIWFSHDLGKRLCLRLKCSVTTDLRNVNGMGLPSSVFIFLCILSISRLATGT